MTACNGTHRDNGNCVGIGYVSQPSSQPSAQPSSQLSILKGR